MKLRKCIPAISIAMLLGCGGEPDVRSNDNLCELDLRVTLSGASNVEFNPIESVGYPNVQGFQMLQYLPDNHGGLAIDTGGDGMGNVAAFLSGNVNAMGKKGTIIFVNTLREYSDGETLSEGIYVYDGTVSYQGADGAQHTVRAFHQMEESLAREKVEYFKNHEPQFALRQKEEQNKKFEEMRRKLAADEARKKRKQDEEDRLAKPVEGNSISLPGTHHVMSICGIEFGVSPAEAEANLGERIEGRPIAVQLKKNQGRIGATYKLKKPFRHFDRAKIDYEGRPPYCVVASIVLLGYVQADSVSKSSCQAELKKVAELLSEHYNLGKISQDRDGWSYDVMRDKPWENESDKIWVSYYPNSGEFKMGIDKSGILHERIKELCELDMKQKDAAKDNVEFGNDSGADTL